MRRTIDAYPIERLGKQDMLELLQGLVGDKHVGADKEHIRIVTLLRHGDGVVHHTAIEDVRQIDRISIAGIGPLAAIGIDDMTVVESRLEFTIEELGIRRGVVVEDTNEDVTLFHGAYGLTCFYPTTAAE